MKNIIAIVSILSLLLLPVSCMKAPTPIPDHYKDFIGSWNGENGSRVTINADGTGAMEIIQVKGNATSRNSAKPANIEIGENEIAFGAAFGLQFRFTVNQKPEQSGDQWSMTVGGVAFSR